jgi:hypothetical protein
MAGCIVQIWFEAENEVGAKQRFVMVETEFPDFAAFCEFVDADRLISGATLWTRRRGDEHLIFRRQPCAFRGSAVRRCQLPTWQFVDGEDLDIDGKPNTRLKLVDQPA